MTRPNRTLNGTKPLNHRPEPLDYNDAGFNLLDLLITLLVVTLVLLAAVKQFGGYERFADQPAPQEQPEATTPSP